MGLLDTYLCPNRKCPNKDKGKKGEHCPECGVELEKFKLNEKIGLESRKDYWEKELNKTPEEREKEVKREEREKRLNNSHYFSDETSDEELARLIRDDIGHASSTERGTAWMRVGTLLSMNSGQQMMGAGFKVLINQQKALIKQNEQILRELKRLNEVGSE